MQDHVLLESAQAAAAEYRERMHLNPRHPHSKDIYVHVLDVVERLELTIEVTQFTFDIELRLLADGREPHVLVTAFDTGQAPAEVLASGRIAHRVPEIAGVLLELS